MKNNDVVIMTIAAVVLMLVLFIGHNFKKGMQQKSNWKFGDWNQTQAEKPALPNVVVPEIKKTEVPKVQEKLIASNYEEALKISAERNAPILMIFYNEDCHWCARMAEVYEKDDVKQKMQKLVVLKVNTSEDFALAQKFGVRPIPCFVITNSSEKISSKKVGYMSKDVFIGWLENNSK